MSANSNDPSPTSYDVTPYAASAHPQTHPNRLAAMARMFGLSPASPSSARVLELGCADGSNLLPMAEQHPNASFLGIDASKVQITAGNKAIAAAGLKNVELRHEDILAFSAADRTFDYILVHGIFSWVPEAVREKILSICATQLAPQGIAYISYNALPGWNMKGALRQMMLFHTRDIAQPKKKVAQARALLAFLAGATRKENDPFGLLLDRELNLLKKADDSYILHEFLEADNEPFYFHQFLALAGRHGLQYLGETSLVEMLASNFPEKVRTTLAKLSDNVVRQEQYMDFLRNRQFRQTLLCRRDLTPRRNVKSAAMRSLSFGSQLRPLTGPIDLAPGVTVSVSNALGLTLSAKDTLAKALLQELADSKAGFALSRNELAERARRRAQAAVRGDAANVSSEQSDAVIDAHLLNFTAKGFVDVFAEPVAPGALLPAKPAVSPLVRYQAANSRFVTNRLHRPTKVDALARYILMACDGTRTRNEILEVLLATVRKNKLQVKEGETQITDANKLRASIGATLDRTLKKLAAAGYFAG